MSTAGTAAVSGGPGKVSVLVQLIIRKVKGFFPTKTILTFYTCNGLYAYIHTYLL